MKNGRPWDNVAVSPDFRGQCQLWWTEIQPKGRQPFDTDSTVTNWAPLSNGGTSGIMLILLTLAWWGYSDGMDSEWEGLAEDVAWVLEKMHGCEAPAAGSSAKKRYVLRSIRGALRLILSFRKATDGDSTEHGEGAELRRSRRKDGGSRVSGTSTKR